MFGLSGAHRTGKTTLAKAIAENHDLKYHDASVSAIMREIGYNPVADSTLEQRIGAQEYLLKRYEENLSGEKEPFITDRTPLDFVGYTLAEVGMHNTSPELSDRVDRFVDRCIISTQKLFSGIIVCGFLPFYEEDATKPPPNLAYQRHVQMVIEGALEAANNGVLMRARLKDTNLESRIELVGRFVDAVKANLSEEKVGFTIH